MSCGVGGIFLTEAWCEKAPPTVLGATSGKAHLGCTRKQAEQGNKQCSSIISALFPPSANLEFLPWLLWMMTCDLEVEYKKQTNKPFLHELAFVTFMTVREWLRTTWAMGRWWLGGWLYFRRWLWLTLSVSPVMNSTSVHIWTALLASGTCLLYKEAWDGFEGVNGNGYN